MQSRERAKTTRRRSPDIEAIDALDRGRSLYSTSKPDPLFGPPPSIIETVLFSRVGHTFKLLPPLLFPFPPAVKRYAVQDFLLDQTGTSGADGRMSSTKQFDLTTATRYRFNVLPKNRQKRIVVKPPPSAAVVMGFNVGRRFVNAASDVFDQYTANSFFIGLVGSAPVLTSNSLFIGRNTNHWIHFDVSASIVSTMEFSGFSTYGIYPPRSFDPGIKSYRPFSSGLPFNLSGPASVPFLLFSYITTSDVDPGPFVLLV